MGDAADQHEDVMENMRQRLISKYGTDGIDMEIDPDEAWDEEIKSWAGRDDVEFSSYDIEIEYEIGDIIRLNSGGPLMTIQNINNNTFICRWFDKNNTLQSEKFNILEIKLFNQFEDNDSFINEEMDENEIPF